METFLRKNRLELVRLSIIWALSDGEAESAHAHFWRRTQQSRNLENFQTLTYTYRLGAEKSSETGTKN